MSQLLTNPNTPAPQLTNTPAPSIAATFAQNTVVRYCAIALFIVGKADPVWLQDDGKIVIFDTVANAQDMLELMAEGRQTLWYQNGEECCYQPIFPQVGKTNRALIVTGYDVYNVPALHAVGSETKGMAWKHHIHWGHWFRQVRGVS